MLPCRRETGRIKHNRARKKKRTPSRSPETARISSSLTLLKRSFAERGKSASKFFRKPGLPAPLFFRRENQHVHAGAAKPACRRQGLCLNRPCLVETAAAPRRINIRGISIFGCRLCRFFRIRAQSPDPKTNAKIQRIFPQRRQTEKRNFQFAGKCIVHAKSFEFPMPDFMKSGAGQSNPVAEKQTSPAGKNIRGRFCRFSASSLRR